MTRDQILSAFKDQFGGNPTYVVRSPGRVNLIGEHTDYNDGFVLPAAIDRAIWIALRPRSDRRVSIYSLDFSSPASFDLDDLKEKGKGWLEYARGAAHELQKAGHTLKGWEGVMGGDVPRGAGLSSSAALELAVERSFAAVSGFDWTPTDMALLGQRVENNWVGVNCGIMDQMIVASGKEGTALLIDCRSLDTEPAPLPKEAAIVIMDTGTRRGLVDSAYNERRRQCEEAAAFFGVPALRDVTSEEFEARADGLPEVTRKRARHVITENERTLAAAEKMRQGDAAGLGRLMNESHTSLRDDFEVSSRELDLMVEAAQAHPACIGARMTGAGFGGCAVALVKEVNAPAFVATVSEGYERKARVKPQLYVCHAMAGTELV